MEKICLLKGGNSSEREISFISAKCIANSFDELNYNFIEYDFTGDVCLLAAFLKKESPDCVFNALHGGSGENGNVQAVLNLMKIPYTHSGVTASAIGMNKQLSKDLFAKSGFKVPQGEVTTWSKLLKYPDVDYKRVIKPIDGGSSAGVYLFDKISDLKSIDWKYGDNVLLEDYIPGLELTVGVINDEPLELTNISVASSFYDYHNKYAAGCSTHEVPAKINDDIRNEALETALMAHRIIGCRGVSRSDFRFNNITNQLYILEINTQPGMTATSLLPEQARYVGISYNKLIQLMIEAVCYDI